MKLCPKCQQPMIGVEYSYGSPEHYDGISEWMCEADDLHIGRWSNKVLGKFESEKRFGVAND